MTRTAWDDRSPRSSWCAWCGRVVWATEGVLAGETEEEYQARTAGVWRPATVHGLPGRVCALWDEDGVCVDGCVLPALTEGLVRGG